MKTTRANMEDYFLRMETWRFYTCPDCGTEYYQHFSKKPVCDCGAELTAMCDFLLWHDKDEDN